MPVQVKGEVLDIRRIGAYHVLSLTAPGIAIFVSSGDSGYNDAGQGPDYPGTSANVISVGGTALIKANNTRGEFNAMNHSKMTCKRKCPSPCPTANLKCFVIFST